MGIMGLLLIGSGFASASEVAYFSLSPNDKAALQAENSNAANRVLTALNFPEQLLAALLVLNNLFNLALIILSTYLTNVVFNFNAFPWLAIGIQTVLVTTLLLIFGEVIPKTYAASQALVWSKRSSLLVLVSMRVFKPVTRALVYSSRVFERMNKPKRLTVEALEDALDLTATEATTPDQKRLLKEIVRFGNTSVKQIMTPRKEIIGVEHSRELNDVLSIIAENGYSRVPVFEENLDSISGVLHAKDLLPLLDSPQKFDWTEVVRNTFFVPEGMKIDDLLGDFREKKMHLAIVVDEYGGVSGLVTLEDVLEEIVGEIRDEFDAEEQYYSQLDEDTYVFEAHTHLSDLFRVLSLDPLILDTFRGEADTVAGLILEQLGRMPVKGEKIETGALKWTIEACDRRRIVRVKVKVDRNGY